MPEKEKGGKDKMFQMMLKNSICICVILEGRATTAPARSDGQGHNQGKAITRARPGVQTMGHVRMVDCGNDLV